MTNQERIYRRLLALYPRPFRSRFEAEMVQLFGDQLRDARVPGERGGSLRLWVRTVLDLLTSALSERIRRDRTVAHSASAAPSVSARALGAIGVIAGVILVAPYLVALDQGWYPARNIAFVGFVMALVIGLYPRLAAASPRLARGASVLALLGYGWYLIWIVLSLGRPYPGAGEFGFIGFLAGMALWLAAAGYGAAALRIGAFSRLGPILLVVGSLLTATGIDRLGLVHGDFGGIFGPLSQVGGVLHGCAWIVLGAELALRRPSGVPTARA